MFLQSIGLLPDNVVILSTSREKLEERIREKLKNTNGADIIVKNSADEAELNLRAVKEVFKGFYTEINTSEKNKSTIIDDIAVWLLYNTLENT